MPPGPKSLPNCAPILRLMSGDREARQEVRATEKQPPPADERALWTQTGDGVDQGRLYDVLPLIESNVTIQEVAERLGISVEGACGLVVAGLRSKHKEEQHAKEILDLLEAAGFKPIEDDDSLWSKDGVYYGREAALQQAWRKLREGDDEHAAE